MARVVINGVDQDIVEIRRLTDTVKHLGAIYEAGLKWRWRLLAIIVTIASVISAVFQALSFWLHV